MEDIERKKKLYEKVTFELRLANLAILLCIPG